MVLLSKELLTLTAVGTACFVLGGALGYHLLLRQQNHDDYVNPLNHQVALEKYIVDHSLREPAILRELRTYTVENVERSITLNDVIEAQLFRILLNLLDAKKCIQVGVNTGYNTLNMALSLPADGSVYAIDTSEQHFDHAKQFFNKARVNEKIKIKIGFVGEAMEDLIEDGEGGAYDFIYVNANKGNYNRYYESGLALLRTGGMMAIDNIFQGGCVLNPATITDVSTKLDVEAIHEFNVKISKDGRVAISMLNIADGVTLCLKL